MSNPVCDTTTYTSESDLPDYSVMVELRSGDNSLDDNGTSEYAIDSGDGDDGQYVWWGTGVTDSGNVSFDLNLGAGGGISWEVDSNPVSDDSITYGNLSSIAIEAFTSLTGATVAWKDLSVSFYDSNNVIIGDPSIDSSAWPYVSSKGASVTSIVMITPTPSAVRVHVTGTVQLIRPTSNLNPGPNQLFGRIFVYE